MLKIEYLKQSLLSHQYRKKSWLISNFSITSFKDLPNAEYEIAIDQFFNYKTIIGDTVVTIDDAIKKAPLFSFKDKLTIDGSWYPGITAPIETTLGRLLFNYIAIYSSFGTKFPYINEMIDVGKIENQIAAKLQSTTSDKSDAYYYVDELIKFNDATQFICQLSTLCTISATPKNIVKPPGINEFKAKLIKEYGDRLRDPVVLAEYEKKLKAYDEEWLKDDPSNGVFLTGKLKNVARKKMYLGVGMEGSFDESPASITPITNSLDQGWHTTPEEFTAAINGQRSGAVARGLDTQKGGVLYKQLIRSTNNIKITDNDCGSKLGLHRTFNLEDYRKLINRYIILPNGGIKLIESEEEAKKYVDKEVILRSPMFCKESGSNRCRVCMGESMAKIPKGLTIPITEISSIVLNTFMKRMHVTGVSTTPLDITHVFS
jgi:hypothetical protein